MDVYIGDTPEQLDCGMLIDGELWTAKRIKELQAQVEQLRQANQKLIPLARRCLWGALVWNDHNFDQPLHVYCRQSVSESGIINVDQANDFLDKAGN